MGESCTLMNGGNLTNVGQLDNWRRNESSIKNQQGHPSRGFLGGGMCTPAFLPSPGNSYIRRKNCTCFFFPKIPRLMHPCYLGRMGAPENKVHFSPQTHVYPPKYPTAHTHVTLHFSIKKIVAGYN